MIRSQKKYQEGKKSPQKTRIRLLTTTVIPAMTYGCETWTSKEADTKRLQRAVSNMFEIAGCDPPDMEKQVLRRKLKWAGHVSRMKYDRWAKIVSEWDPRGSARPRGRPPKRWADDIKDSIKIFIHNEALRGNLGHGRRRIGILEARRAWAGIDVRRTLIISKTTPPAPRLSRNWDHILDDVSNCLKKQNIVLMDVPNTRDKKWR
uniref:Uncharacterized protein n=1 Tax=Caenorhabditis japonica TaxID=281687 RepID=A0A8R1I8H3_CAEJA